MTCVCACVCFCHLVGCIPDCGPVWRWPGTRLLCCEQCGSTHWLVRKSHTHTYTQYTDVLFLWSNCIHSNSVDSFCFKAWKTQCVMKFSMSGKIKENNTEPKVSLHLVWTYLLNSLQFLLGHCHIWVKSFSQSVCWFVLSNLFCPLTL